MKKNLRKTKIVGTIGPASEHKLEELILVTINNQGRMYVKPKKGSYFTIDTNYSGGNV